MDASDILKAIVDHCVAWPNVRPIAGAPGYCVTTAGAVVSFVPSKRLRAVPHVLRPAFTGRGHGRVVLVIDGEHHTKLVHRLVAEAFLGPPPFHDAQVRHLDGTPANNSVGNLVWGTRAENMRDMVRHGRSQRGERSSLSTLNEAKALRVLAFIDIGYGTSWIAREVGCSLSAVSHIRHGRSWSHLRDESAAMVSK
jgi:HNH endonuclease